MSVGTIEIIDECCRFSKLRAAAWERIGKGNSQRGTPAAVVKALLLQQQVLSGSSSSSSSTTTTTIATATLTTT